MSRTVRQQIRKIGNAEVPAIGFGVMSLGDVFYFTSGSREPDDPLKVLSTAYEQGCTHWDTANVYGKSEEIIGKWFKQTGKRDEIFLATKFGITPHGINGDPEHMKEQFNQSLKRLNTDYVDLYYIHRIDSKTPIEITIRAMAELVKEGKIKYLGLSECTAKGLRRAHAIHPISAVQLEVSPFVLDIWDPKLELLKTARELGVTVVCYSPLGRGLLTGQYKSPDDFEANDFRRTIPKYSPENFPKILDVVSKIQQIGKERDATSGQATLAWVLAQGDDFVVIPGTRSTRYLLENLGAANVQLTKEEVDAIIKIANDADLSGERYGGVNAERVYVESPELQE